MPVVIVQGFVNFFIHRNNFRNLFGNIIITICLGIG